MLMPSHVTCWMTVSKDELWAELNFNLFSSLFHFSEQASCSVTDQVQKMLQYRMCCGHIFNIKELRPSHVTRPTQLLHE